MKLEIYDVVHDVANSKAVIYATSSADTPFGGFKWINECTVLVLFTEDGEQIKRMDEMVDTTFYHEFSSKFQRYLQENGKIICK